MLALVHACTRKRWAMDKNRKKITRVGLETPGKWACDVHCFKHPPVAAEVKAPMVARQTTGHRNYCDGRYGTIHRIGAWQCSVCKSGIQDGWSADGIGKGMA